MVARKTDPNGFGRLIAAHLRRAKLSQAGFARMIGMKPTTLGMLRYRRPKRERPAADIVTAWAKPLGLSAAEVDELRLQIALVSSPALVQDAFVALREALAAAKKRAALPEKPSGRKRRR